MELLGKVVVVTGSSRGIGRALAAELAKSGCKLLLTALEESELSCLENELKAKYSAEVAGMAADLTDFSSRRALVEWIKNREEPPDILINNAGAGFFRRFEHSSWQTVEKTIALNIQASTHLTHELLPVLKQRPEAKIVNISSGISRLPYPGLAVYGAAKGFVSSLSESLACELVGTPVGVLCFHPGFAMTHFIESGGMDMSKIPKRFITPPEKVAARIVRAIRKDRQWDYSDLVTRFGVFLGGLMPARFRTLIFKNLFWRLPDEEKD